MTLKKKLVRINLIGIWELIRIEEQDENGNWTQTTLECRGATYIEFKNDGSFGGECCPNTLQGNYEVYENNKIKIVGGPITEAINLIWTPKYEKYLMKLKSYSILSDTLTMSGDKFRIIHKSLGK